MPINKIRILLIEDEEFDVRRVRKTLEPFSDRIDIVQVVSNGKAAVEILETGSHRIDVVIMDFQIAGGLMGETLIRRIKSIDTTLQIIVITKMTINVTDFQFASQLITAGAMWYCAKYPGDIEDYIYQPTDFLLSIFNAYEKRQLAISKRKADQKLEQTVQDRLTEKELIGESYPILNLKKVIKRTAAHDTNVLITGESGTGKELIAAHIHYQSKRRLEIFLPVNCGSLPAHLIESELFGYEKGAFTGAEKEKQGFFELADKGTLFLDEITELPLATQSSLLRVLQDGEIDKIGRQGKLKVNVRVIAATNMDIREEVREKRFREDLFYRLNVVSLTAPPLRQHLDDVPLLLEHYLNYYQQQMNLEKPSITVEAKAMLARHEWKGNVRELQNVVQRLMVSGHKSVEKADVRTALGMDRDHITAANGASYSLPQEIKSLKEVERTFRLHYFNYVRERTDSDAEAARLLGLAPPNFHRMCKELGIK